jgi:hypothetical protein
MSLPSKSRSNTIIFSSGGVFAQKQYRRHRTDHLLGSEQLAHDVAKRLLHVADRYDVIT